MKILTFTVIILNSIIVYSQQKPNYPEPEKGMKRVDLLMPKIENSNDFKIEIRFGMEMNVSECTEIKDFSFNIKNLEKKFGIPPYRFPYYILPNDITTEIVSQKINNNCDENKKVKKKVLSYQSLSEEYNSFFAIPYYIPENWTLEYRLWKVNSEYKNAEK